MTVVTGALPDEARQVVKAVAADRGAHVDEAAVSTRVNSEVRQGQATLTIETAADRYGPLTLALRGEHQVGNALVALRLLETLRTAGVAVPRQAIVQGLTTVDWPARLELIRLAGGRQVLIDSAHNVDGSAALAAYLERWHPERPALVIGVMRDKDVEAIIERLLPVVSSVTATAASTPRAIPADELAARIRTRRPDAQADADPARAVERALDRHETVCVAGSIFLAGDVREGLKRRAILR
jgi:dihydrofolate synthase/folylpolyglutamate synthase